MLLDVEESQLVLVDYQVRLMPAMLDGPWRWPTRCGWRSLAALLHVPAFATEQNPSGLGATVPELQAALQPAGARVLSKMQFSAVEEGLGEWLRPPPKPVQGNARSLPKHLQKPLRVPSAAPLCWPVARPMCACCRPHWTCWKMSLTCGS